MDGSSIIPASQANLPRTYEAAKTALAECSALDECKDWSDKAAALASYAKQAQDETLMTMAQRIKARAVRRSGELLKQIDSAKGGDRKSEQYQSEGDHTLISRDAAAREAGMSKHQQVQATRIASVPQKDFDAQVESPTPPTLTQLASQGIKPRENIVDLRGRDPKQFNRAMHFVGEFQNIAEQLEKLNITERLKDLDDKERSALRGFVARIDLINDQIIGGL